MKNIVITRSVKVILISLSLALFTVAQSPGDLDPADGGLPKNGQPVSSILNADGSIRNGVSGSFDPKGFRMVAGRDGSPRFVADNLPSSGLSPEANCGDGWDDRFGGSNGINGYVHAVASDGAGNVYIGGSFSAAGNVPASNIAKWDGSSWSAIGSGVSGEYSTVNTIAVAGTGDVYVGGYFTTAGGVPANSIAKWDGSSWSALGSGVNFFGVSSIAVSGTDVYVGGYFTSAGGVAGTEGVAKWNGTSWSALGSGITVQTYCVKHYCYVTGVNAIGVSGSDIYVGGLFWSAGEIPANSIAKWNGSSWSALGSGDSFGGYGVFAIAVSGSDVYVGGEYGIAKWNGSGWSSLGTGVYSQNGDRFVNSIAVSGANVYVGGYFTTASGIPVNNVARWNGSSWSALASGTNHAVGAIAVSGSDLYAGGYFTTAGCHAASYFSRYTAAAPAAQHQISGRVTVSSGRGIPRVRVTLDDGAGNVRLALTSSFGYFMFDAVPTGIYTVSAESKGHSFAPQTIGISTSITDLDFTALENP